MLSAVSLNIPFPEHSQYPRNAFSCQQTKHAVGVYSSAYTENIVLKHFQSHIKLSSKTNCNN